MTQTAEIEVRQKDPLTSLRSFFKTLLDKDEVDALLIPSRLKGKKALMPALVTDPECLDGADPIAPAFMLNGAGIMGGLTRKPSGKKIVAVLRPCEIRATVELVKLKQASLTDVLILGIDCPGAFQNKDYRAVAGEDPDETTREFMKAAFSGACTGFGAKSFSESCKSCVFPVPEGIDLSIGIYGMDTEKSFLLQSFTPRGDELFQSLVRDSAAAPAKEPEERALLVEKVKAARAEYQDRLMEETRADVDSPEKLAARFADCVNCYNCRVACPVCYCRECVFNTDVFDHEPFQYFQWAKRKGGLKLPADTIFFHLTRLVHMSLSCVGCGQCSNACPNDIRIAEVFKMSALNVQAAFSYRAGRDPDEAPPMSVFGENEFSDVMGMKDRSPGERSR